MTANFCSDANEWGKGAAFSKYFQKKIVKVEFLLAAVTIRIKVLDTTLCVQESLLIHPSEQQQELNINRFKCQ